MVAAQENPLLLTPEAYFAWEAQQLCRHEYINGEVFAMTGGTVNHSEIASKLNRLIGNHLEGKPCKILNSDCRIRIHESDDYTYPDVCVTCDPRDRLTPQYITYPCFIIEVLSPSTEAYDRGAKFRRYRRNPVLQDYLLVSSDKMEVDLYRQQVNQSWQILNYQVGDRVELQSIEFSFPLEDVYVGITL